jgi:predicted DNA-binding WGR domain protein
MRREFYYQDAHSNKFWIIEITALTISTFHGRTGTKGKALTKVFENEREAKKEFDKQVTAKLKKGYIEGSPNDAPEYKRVNWASKQMSENVFWEVIGLFDWKVKDTLAPAVKALAKMSEEDIFQFENIMAEKLYHLDTKKLAEHVYGDEKKTSMDDFLYVRCAVVANGESFYNSILNSEQYPDVLKFPDGVDFEPLLYLAMSAYKKKTGEEIDFIDTDYSYETCSNEEG